jgi:hypothetical protein
MFIISVGYFTMCSVPQNIASNGLIKDKLKIVKDLEGSGRGLIQVIFMVELGKSNKTSDRMICVKTVIRTRYLQNRIPEP